LRTIRQAKVLLPDSIETKIFKVLKDIGVELSAYHGGSLNGKDIMKVMNNASFVFDEFAVIFKAAKRPNCEMSDEDIDAMCKHFREVIVLWDGAFSVARMTEYDQAEKEDIIATYLLYVHAALQGLKDLRCSITPKIHLMVMHVDWQMRYVRGGIGDKAEDWVERLHQTGMRLRQHFRSVKNALVRARAREKSNYRNSHPDVLARIQVVNSGGNKRKLVEKNGDTVAVEWKRQRKEGRSEALQYFENNEGEIRSWTMFLFDDEEVDG